MHRLIYIFIGILFFGSSVASDGYMFRLQLKDKNNSGYSITTPESFLSKKSIERRTRQNIAIDDSDLPISDEYIEIISNLGYPIVAKSKWLNTISILCSDSSCVESIKDLDFVDQVTFVWKSDSVKIGKKDPIKRKSPTTKSSSTYGYAHDQISTLNGQYLHENGFKGQGMEIAVIDAGYSGLKEILLLDNVFIKGIKDFVYNGQNMLESSDHGLHVFSAMAANRPGTYVGTAPKAKYWLFRSEDNRSEFPIEEDYWITAVEYADSVGVDLINTSLGYTRFDSPAKSYTQDQLDGRTSPMTKVAELAALKGIFTVVSAGNEGYNPWEKISFPADAEHGLTVGSMTKDSLISTFSSIGPTADGRIKPDVVALGDKINLIGSDGDIIINNGTSFAGPVVCGLVACLWQAYPELTSLELLDIIKQSSSKYQNPGNAYGYGIPNMKLAMQLAEGIPTGIVDEQVTDSTNIIIESDSIGHIRVYKPQSKTNENFKLLIVGIDGKILINEELKENAQNYNFSNTKQAYIINIISNSRQESRKVYF